MILHFDNPIQGHLTAICLFGFAVTLFMLITLLFSGFREAVEERWRSFKAMRRFDKAFWIFTFCFMTLTGATKGWTIRFDGGIKDGVPASYVTNDTISITWQVDPRAGIPLPDEAAVYIDYRPNTATNEDWGLLAQSTVGAGHWNGTLADATNYNYNVWAYYIPPEPVKTNGIWTFKTLRDRNDRHIIPLRAIVECDGRAISTPDAKRRDILNHIWRIAPYFYGFRTADTFPEEAQYFYDHVYEYDAGQCSVKRVSSTVWRNYDWTLDFAAEALVIAERTDGRFKSMGMAAVGRHLTEETASSGEWTRAWLWMPGHMLDGINENGVFAEINVTATNRMDGWNSDGSLHCLAAVRWVLDHGTDAQQAAEYLAANVRRPRGMNFHYMICDPNGTFIVENGEAHRVDGAAIMTNFDKYGDGDGSGTERYEILAGGGSITNVWFTKAYVPSATPWTSDIGENHEAVWSEWSKKDKEGHRGETVRGQSWWQTLHTAVYDLQYRSVSVTVQETGTAHTFYLNEE